MRQQQILALCREEEAAASAGGSAEHLAHRMTLDPLPWDYRDILLPYLREAQAFVDMGVGDGSFLAPFRAMPRHAHATLSDPSLLDAARLTLSVMGVKVHPVEREEDLPFQQDYFHLVSARHTRFCAQSVFSVLRSGGTFVTEQVGSGDCIGLNQHLETRRPPDAAPWDLHSAVAQLKEAGFWIRLARAYAPVRRFYDVGAAVYYAKSRPDQFPDFSVAKCEKALLTAQRFIDTWGCIEAKASRFLIVAKKGGEPEASGPAAPSYGLYGSPPRARLR